MKTQEKMELLKEYIKANVAPILVDFIQKDFLEDAVVIDSKCRKEELNEIYEGEKTLAPKWYQKLINENKKILVINNIDSISIEEQNKFIELIKYRKVSTFELPQDIRIIIIAKEVNAEKINKEIYSLTACIGG